MAKARKEKRAPFRSPESGAFVPLSGEALGSAIVLLQFPGNYIVSISEEIEHDWNQTRRSVKVNYALPYPPTSKRLSWSSRDLGPTERDLHLLPIAACHKDDLLSISDLEVPGSRLIRLLSHDEALAASRMMLRALFVLIFADWLADPVDVDAKVKILQTLDEIVNLPESEARPRLQEIFIDEGKDHGHRLRDHPDLARTSPRKEEESFYELCSALCRNYLIIAKTFPENPQQCSVSWVMTRANDWQRIQGRDWLRMWTASGRRTLVADFKGTTRYELERLLKPLDDLAPLPRWTMPFRNIGTWLYGQSSHDTTGEAVSCLPPRRNPIRRTATLLHKRLAAWPTKDFNRLRSPLDVAGTHLRSLLGDAPRQLRIVAPLARRTADYHLRVEAPDGHYCHEAIAIRSPLNVKTRSKHEARLDPMSKAQPRDVSFLAASGTRSSAHVFIRNGVRSKDWLDINIIWLEVPLGSIGGVTLAAILAVVPTTFLYVSLVCGRSVTQVPASFVVVALTACLTPALGMVLDTQRRPNLWSRSILLGLALFTTWFAIWWAMVASTIPDADPPSAASSAVATTSQDTASGSPATSRVRTSVAERVDRSKPKKVPTVKFGDRLSVLGLIPTSAIALLAAIGTARTTRTVLNYRRNRKRGSTKAYARTTQNVAT